MRKLRDTREKATLIPVPKKAIPKDARSSNLVRALKWEPGPPIGEFPEIFDARSFNLPQRELQADGWRLESPVNFRLLEKLRRAGPPLGEYVQGRFYYGLKTGLNEAFVVDRKARDRLIAEHRSSAEVLRPFLRGRDVKRWTVDLPDLWLLFVPWHFPLDKDESVEGASAVAEAEFKKRFPAIYKHLLGYKDQLKDRNAAETGVRYEWYALQRWGSEYWQEFDRPKILYQEIATYQAFGWDDRSHFTNNKTFFIPDASHFLLGVLNSRPCWWFLSQVAQKMVGGALALQTPYVEQIPIPSTSSIVESQITSIVGEILARKRNDVNSFVDDLDAQNDGLVAHLYGMTEEEFRIILDDLRLNDPVRVSALNAYRDTKRSLAK